MIAGYDADWRGGWWRAGDGMGCAGGAGAVGVRGGGARGAGGKLPPHVVVYLVMALALFADDDYEEVAARLTETLRGWGCRGDWGVPTKGAVPRPPQGLGSEPVAQVFSQVAGPVADLDTAGAFL